MIRVSVFVILLDPLFSLTLDHIPLPIFLFPDKQKHKTKHNGKEADMIFELVEIFSMMKLASFVDYKLLYFVYMLLSLVQSVDRLNFS